MESAHPTRSDSFGARAILVRNLGRFVSIALLAGGLCVSVLVLLRTILHAVPSEEAAVPYAPAVTVSCMAALLGLAALAMEWRMAEPREHAFAPLRRFLVVAVAAWIACLAWVQPYTRARMEIAAAITVGAFALLRLAEPLFQRLPRKLRRAADIVLFNICLTLVGGELALRAYAYLRPMPIFAHFEGTPRERIDSMRLKPGTWRYLFPCNQLGEYDEEFRPRGEGEHLAITIGDSFSLGTVPHAYHFTTVCERKIGTQVYNMGVAAIDTLEYAYLLEHEALPLKPELVVIDVFVGNDLIFIYEGKPAFDALFRSWLDRRNVLMWLVPNRLMRILEEQRARANDQGPVGTAQDELAVALGVSEATIEEHFRWVADPMLEKATFSEKAFPRIELQRALGICHAGTDTLRPFCDVMLEMKRMAGSTPFAVMLIPDEFQVEDAVWQSVLEHSTDKDLDRDRPHEILVPWFAEHGIPCLDLLPLLRAVPPLPDGRKHVYHMRDTHFNARGNRVVGEALAEFIRRNWPHVCAK